MTEFYKRIDESLKKIGDVARVSGFVSGVASTMRVLKKYQSKVQIPSEALDEIMKLAENGTEDGTKND